MLFVNVKSGGFFYLTQTNGLGIGNGKTPKRTFRFYQTIENYWVYAIINCNANSHQAQGNWIIDQYQQQKKDQQGADYLFYSVAAQLISFYFLSHIFG